MRSKNPLGNLGLFGKKHRVVASVCNAVTLRHPVSSHIILEPNGKTINDEYFPLFFFSFLLLMKDIF